MPDNRENIIEATQRLLQSHGLARLTTRDIARGAGVAEGLIYHHFKDKAELIFEVVLERVRDTKDVLQNLPLKVGTNTIRENLEEVLHTIYRGHYEIVPIICSMFADRRLHIRMLEIMKERNLGSQKAIEGLKVYLAAEQRLGRLSSNINPQAAANCLWLISIQSAMDDNLMENAVNDNDVRRQISDYVQTLMAGMAPRDKTGKINRVKK